MSRRWAWTGLALLGLTAVGCLPFRWLAGPGEPLPAPFVLRPDEQAELDRVLAAWDGQYAGLKTLSCRPDGATSRRSSSRRPGRDTRG